MRGLGLATLFGLLGCSIEAVKFVEAVESVVADEFIESVAAPDKSSKFKVNKRFLMASNLVMSAAASRDEAC